MKKIFTFISALLIVFLFAVNVFALVLTWDAYTDLGALGLRVESSIDQQIWSTLVDNIPTEDIAVALPLNQVDYQRVYYRMRAFSGTEVSDPSNVVSFYWTTGGGGSEGVGSPGGVGFIDCSDPQNATEQQICTDLGL